MSRSDGFGNADDGADWLLAQLANGHAPERADPPVAPPPAAPTPSPAAAVPPPAAAPPAHTPAPRRGEVLDWFSLAEPAASTDAATRALPVVGSPDPSHAPEPAQPPAAAAPPAQQPNLPSWSPPFAVTRPAPPAAPPSVHLTQVEPPVGTPPVASAPVPPVAEPVPPAVAPVPPVAPAAPVVPPGPVTPTAPFALTWGGNDLESEESLRAAFRALSEPGGAAPATPAEPQPQSQPPASAPPVEPDPSPFAGFAPPPVARQSFTPVQPEPQRHPTTPATAPPSWGEREARAATPNATNFDQELWAALNEPDPDPAAPTGAPAGSFQPAVAPAPQPIASPAPPPAVPAPVQPTASRDPSSAFAAEATDPFAALDTARASRNEQVAPDPSTVAAPQPSASPSAEATPAPPAAATPAPPFAAPLTAPRAPAVDPGPTRAPQTSGLPFIEVRGDAESPLAQPVGAPWHESAATARSPFPAFASSNNGDDDPTREPPAPVDDLLASLGGGASRSRDSLPPAVAPGGSGGGTPPTAPDPAGLDALGLGFGDDDSDDDDAADELDAPQARLRGGPFGRTSRGRESDDDDGDDEGGSDDSPIARELAASGYFWNLTPDPTAEDPKANAEVTTVGLERPVPFAADPFSTDQSAEPEAESEAEPEPEPEPEWAFGADETAGFPVQPAERADVFPPDDEWQAAPTWPAASAHPTATFDATDDPDPLAELFGGAGAAGAGAAGAGAPGSSGAAAASHSPFVPAGTAGAPTGGRAATPDWRIAPNTPAPASSAPTPRTTSGSGNGGGTGSGGTGGSGGSGDSKPGASRTTRTLIWVAGSLVVLLVIAGLFYLGTQLTRGGGGASPSAEGTPSAVEETPVPPPTAPQPVGVHAWNTLFGGECVDPFVDVWAQEFAVVDCVNPHAAQLVYRGMLPGDAAAPFPGEAELGTQMATLCRADGVIDSAAASPIPDLQVQGSYPLAEQWAAGERTYYCFVNRAGGEPITGTLQGPGPAV
ncbi:hypothetical protein [Agromyces ramosus]|uniref:Regulator of septum formation n=1 Tax=Agromyces ramosus TaxID=33879 RepID=A0ABU0R9S2_9MICO|nr:hypothetical protein [Agromyces ramosus]MDQ0893799.1 hypothetical protein [Agromyces ramosus]